MTSPARSALSQAELAGVAGRGLGGLGASEQPLVDVSNLDGNLMESADIETLILQHTLASKIKYVTATGVDGDPGPADWTIAGMQAGDVLLAVLDAANVAQDLTKFAVASGKLVVTGLDLSGFDYVVIFIDTNATVTL